MAKTLKSFSGADVLITGGLGFVGSNLAIELAKRKANVTIIDSLRPDYGGSMFNIEPVKDRVDVKVQDLNDFGKTCEAVRGKDFIFTWPRSRATSCGATSLTAIWTTAFAIP